MKKNFFTFLHIKTFICTQTYKLIYFLLVIQNYKMFLIEFFLFYEANINYMLLQLNMWNILII